MGFKGLGFLAALEFIISDTDIGPFWDDVVSEEHLRHEGVRAKRYLNPPKVSEIMPPNP